MVRKDIAKGHLLLSVHKKLCRHLSFIFSLFHPSPGGAALPACLMTPDSSWGQLPGPELDTGLDQASQILSWEFKTEWLRIQTQEEINHDGLSNIKSIITSRLLEFSALGTPVTKKRISEERNNGMPGSSRKTWQKETEGVVF